MRRSIVLGANRNYSVWCHDINGDFFVTQSNLHPKTEIIGGILQQECEEIIQNFFKQKR